MRSSRPYINAIDAIESSRACRCDRLKRVDAIELRGVNAIGSSVSMKSGRACQVNAIDAIALRDVDAIEPTPSQCNLCDRVESSVSSRACGCNRVEYVQEIE